MRTIGILGGSSDQATAAYYALLNQTVNARLGGWNTAEVIINSMNFADSERFVRNSLWEEAALSLSRRAASLERAGADLLICASNTLHRVADSFTAAVSIPFLHIVDPTAHAIQAQGLRRVALLGTKATMSMDFMQRRYADRFGIEALVPSAPDQAEIDRIIFDELCRGVFTAQSRAAYIAIINKLRLAGAQGVILGCTEIPLLISPADLAGFPSFNTLSLHVEAAVDLSLAG